MCGVMVNQQKSHMQRFRTPARMMDAISTAILPVLSSVRKNPMRACKAGRCSLIFAPHVGKRMSLASLALMQHALDAPSDNRTCNSIDKKKIKIAFSHETVVCIAGGFLLHPPCSWLFYDFATRGLILPEATPSRLNCYFLRVPP